MVSVNFAFGSGFFRIHSKNGNTIHVLVGWGCHKKRPQLECLHQAEYIFSQFWSLGARDQGVSRFDFSETSCLGLQSATILSLCPQMASPCLSIPGVSPSPYKRPGLGPHTYNLTNLTDLF